LKFLYQNVSKSRTFFSFISKKEEKSIEILLFLAFRQSFSSYGLTFKLYKPFIVSRHNEYSSIFPQKREFADSFTQKSVYPKIFTIFALFFVMNKLEI